MRFSDIPTYNDPFDFENGENTFPCNTQYMVYNPLEHKYYLTEEALNYFGLDVDGKYVSDNPNKRDEFIKKVTKKIYDYIRYKAGRNCYEITMFRIAKGYCKTEDGYSCRNDFQECLVSEARYLLENGDSAEYSKENLEKGIIEEKKPEEIFMDTSDIAPEAKRTLNFLGFDRWFRVGQYWGLNKDEY